MIVFGLLLGLSYGLLFTSVASSLLPRLAQGHAERLSRMVERPRFTLWVTLVLYLGIINWGILGAVMGGVFLAVEGAFPGGGAFTPNVAYAAGTSLLALALGAAGVWRVPRARIHALILAPAFAVTFGWLLPLLGR